MINFARSILWLFLFILLITSCSKKNEEIEQPQGAFFNNNEVILIDDPKEFENGVFKIDLHDQILGKNTSFSFNLQAQAPNISLGTTELAATDIKVKNDLVYVSWHLPGERVYGSVTLYHFDKQSQSYVYLSRVDLPNCDIHGLDFLGSDLLIYGQKPYNKTEIERQSGFLGAFISLMDISSSGFFTPNLSSTDLKGFGVNDIEVVGDSVIFAGTGNEQGHLYKLAADLSIQQLSEQGFIHSLSKLGDKLFYFGASGLSSVSLSQNLNQLNTYSSQSPYLEKLPLSNLNNTLFLGGRIFSEVDALSLGLTHRFSVFVNYNQYTNPNQADFRSILDFDYHSTKDLFFISTYEGLFVLNGNKGINQGWQSFESLKQERTLAGPRGYYIDAPVPLFQRQFPTKEAVIDGDFIYLANSESGVFFGHIE